MLSLQHGVIFGIRQGTLLYGSTDTEALSTAVASKGNLDSLVALITTLDTTFMGW